MKAGEIELTEGAWIPVGGIMRWSSSKPAGERVSEILESIREQRKREDLSDYQRRQQAARSYIARVTAEYDLPENAIASRNRSARYVDARHVVAWLLRRDRWTYPEIGVELKRDHTSIMYAVSRVERSATLLQVALAIHAEMNELEVA